MCWPGGGAVRSLSLSARGCFCRILVARDLTLSGHVEVHQGPGNPTLMTNHL